MLNLPIKNICQDQSGNESDEYAKVPTTPEPTKAGAAVLQP